MTENTTPTDALKRSVVTGKPVEDNVDLGSLIGPDASALVAALCVLAGGDAVGQGWVAHIEFDRNGTENDPDRLDPANRAAMMAWVSCRDGAVEADVDARLDAGGPAAAAIVDALARASIAWDHPAIGERLDDDRSRPAAGLVMAGADVDRLGRWLGQCDVVDDALDVLRAGALSRSEGLDEPVSAWRASLSALDGAAAERIRLDGLAATYCPRRFARAALAGDDDIDWVSDPPVAADFLQVWGPTSWLETLGVLEAADDDALDFGCLLAVAAAAGRGERAPDDDQGRRLADLVTTPAGADPQTWQPAAAALGLSFPVAVAPDDDLALVACQVAAHERLVYFGFHAPAVPGLPVSATAKDAIDLEASTAVLEAIVGANRASANKSGANKSGAHHIGEMSDTTTVAVVRTLVDLGRLVSQDPDRFTDHARHWAEALAEADSPAIGLARRQLLAAIDGQPAANSEPTTLADALVAGATDAVDRPEVIGVLERHAAVQGPLGLDCARRLAAIGSDDALDALARLWAAQSVYRASFYRACLVDGLHRRVERRA